MLQQMTDQTGNRLKLHKDKLGYLNSPRGRFSKTVGNRHVPPDHRWIYSPCFWKSSPRTIYKKKLLKIV